MFNFDYFLLFKFEIKYLIISKLKKYLELQKLMMRHKLRPITHQSLEEYSVCIII